MFPTYSRLVQRPDFEYLFRRVRTPLLLGGGAVVSALLACGPSLVRVLYVRRYVQAGWILQYLSAAAGSRSSNAPTVRPFSRSDG